MRRGDLVIAAAPGEYGKPRPAVVVQRDEVNDTHASIVVCPLSSHLVDAPLFRIRVDPGPENGLAVPSQIMVDKLVALRRDRIKQRIGRIGDELLVQLNRSLAFWLGL